MVKALGNQLLARAALSDHKDGTIERRGAARPLDRVEEGQALTDELIGSLHAPTVGGKPHLLARYFGREFGGIQRIYGLSATFGKVARVLYMNWA